MNPTDGPARRSGYDWQAVADRLRAHPGQWFTLDDAPPHATSWQVNRGLITAMRPAGDFDATRSEGVLYVRYVGTDMPEE